MPYLRIFVLILLIDFEMYCSVYRPYMMNSPIDRTTARGSIPEYKTICVTSV